MKIYIGSDHAGYKMKEMLKEYIMNQLHIDIEDIGPWEYNAADDYPDFIYPVAEKVAAEIDAGALGIILGGSGQGEAIVANRVPHIRATVYYGGDEQIVKLGREHNDANVLSLGARFLSDEEAQKAVRIFCETLFSEEPRHVRRIIKIDQ